MSQLSNEPMSQTIAIIGGTGKEGNAIAARFARAGVNVVIGSRDAGKGENAAREMNVRFGVTTVVGTSNRDAAARADIILLAVPYAGMQLILEDMRDAA
jgi:hypothetical protein